MGMLPGSLGLTSLLKMDGTSIVVLLYIIFILLFYFLFYSKITSQISSIAKQW